MNFFDWLEKLNHFTDEEIVIQYLEALSAINDKSVDCINACKSAMIQRFVDSVIYFPADRKDGDKNGNSNDD